MIRIAPDEIRELVESQSALSEHDLDEMAVPTYTHTNPLARWIFWKRHATILRLASVGQGDRVLDFGTGTGALLPTLSSLGAVLHATDIRDAVARLLVAHFGLHVTFHPALSLDESIEDDSMDVIIAADVLEHIEEPELSEYMQLFARKLAPQGKLILSVPTENVLYKFGRAVAGFSEKGHYHRTGIKELRLAARRADFSETQIRQIPMPGPGCLFHVSSSQVR
ncbi:MAG: hypothetical protein CL917_18155 [Deltaproteobacteria bacterium]|nr:hypothetical protein [Deltaproteobacteria bacterium]